MKNNYNPAEEAKEIYKNILEIKGYVRYRDLFTDDLIIKDFDKTISRLRVLALYLKEQEDKKLSKLKEKLDKTKLIKDRWKGTNRVSNKLYEKALKEYLDAKQK